MADDDAADIFDGTATGFGTRAQRAYWREARAAGPPPDCNYCGEDGHASPECPVLAQDRRSP